MSGDMVNTLCWWKGPRFWHEYVRHYELMKPEQSPDSREA